jgi:uncharacterized Zn finger protein
MVKRFAMPRNYGSWDYYGYFPPSRPLEARGGIKAQSKQLGKSWWAKRWIAVLESFDIGARLSRGRSYARSGQVLSIDIAKSKVTAKVQGSRPKPYTVVIAVKALAPADWQKVVDVISAQAIYSAKLLNGAMPQDIETVFAEARVSLFPEKLNALSTDCSCPDWSNPCKHIAAVYYLLGEEFDRDPFLLFKLRGLDRDELFALLGQRHAPSGAAALEAGSTPSEPPEPLPTDPTIFWSGQPLSADAWGEARRPPVVAALPKRLGPLPFWRGTDPFLDTLEKIYTAASERGEAVYVGEYSTAPGARAEERVTGKGEAERSGKGHSP